MKHTKAGRGLYPVLREQVERGLDADLLNVELQTLRAIVLRYLDRRQETEQIVAQLPADHLRYHLINRVCHPMELAVDALVAAGLMIPEAVPNLGPLTPTLDRK